MTPDFPTDPRQALEASITALLLGELLADQEAFLRETLERDAELRKTYQRLERTIGLVRQTTLEPAAVETAQPAPLRLTEGRRQEILQRFKTVSLRDLRGASRSRWSALVPIGIAALVIVTLGAMLLPALSRAKYKSRAMASSTRHSQRTWSLGDESPATWQGKDGDRVEGNSSAAVSAPPASPPDEHSSRAGSVVIALPSIGAAVAGAEPKMDSGADAGNLAGKSPLGAVARLGEVFPERRTEAESTEDHYGLGLAKPAIAAPSLSIAESERAIGRRYGIAPMSGGTGGDAKGGAAEGRPVSSEGTVYYRGLSVLTNGRIEMVPLAPDQQTVAPGVPLASVEFGQERLADKPVAGGQPSDGLWNWAAQGGTGGAGAFTGTLSRSDPKGFHPGYAISEHEHTKNGDVLRAPTPEKEQATKDLLAAGKLDEAEARTRELIAKNPKDQAAYYDLNLIAETRLQDALNRRDLASRNALVDIEKAWDSSAQRKALPQPQVNARASSLATLESNRTLSFGDQPEVGRMLQGTSNLGGANASGGPSNPESPNMLGYVNVPLNQTKQETAVTESVQRQANHILLRQKLADADDAKTAVQKARASATDGVETKREPAFVTSVLKVDPNAFKQSLESISGFDWGAIVQASSPGQGGLGGGGGGGLGGSTSTLSRANVAGAAGFMGGGLQSVSKTNDQAHLQALVRQCLMTVGVDLSPQLGKSLFYDDRNGTLVIRATPDDVETIHQMVEVLGSDSDAAKQSARDKQLSSNMKAPSQANLYARTNLTLTAGQQAIAGKLDQIQLAEVEYKDLPLREVVSNLSAQARRRDPEKRGINFLIEGDSQATNQPGTIDPTTGLPINQAVSPNDISIKIIPKLSDVRLVDVLDAIVKVADKPIKWSIEDYGVVFSSKYPQHDDEERNRIRASPPPPEPQPEVQTTENAFSTFSLNVSDVSFKLAAASLEKGLLPEPASIRSEEFINAFDYRDPEPVAGAPIAFAWERARYPFAQGRDLLRFSLKTAAEGRQAGKPLNLVLLLDNSGSMERADRISIIKEALRVLATQLQAQDTFSVVTFARTPRLWVDGVPGNQAGQVAEEVGNLTPQGGTNLGDAMDLAYQTALRHYQANGINRVVLLTDGAANLGDVEPDELKKKVETNRKQGIALDCFGIGWEGYNDDLLEVLTRNGDGRYGFINTPDEAATEFAAQLAGALHVAASDVKVQVEFNPRRVTAYRQIGYAKHQLTKEQFRDNSVDAAEIGAAESGNALYVIDVNGGGDGPLAVVRVRYKVPGTSEYHEQEWAVPYMGNAPPLEQSNPAMRLAATASAFSEWLATSPYAAEVTPDRLLSYLSGVPEVYGADARPKRLEWTVRQAKSLSAK